MKILIVLIIITGFVIGTLSGCANIPGAASGAAVGASIGALVGQLSGNNTYTTLAGAGIGAGIGMLVGTSMDQYSNNKRLNDLEQQGKYPNSQNPLQKQNLAYAIAAPAEGDAPPGQWVEQKGIWINGQWVPRHKVWQPINPE